MFTHWNRGIVRRGLRRPQGQSAIELVMSLLLFVAMIGMLISMSVYLYMSNTFLTASKEGVRAASTDSDLATSGTYNQGVSDTRQRVKDFIASSTGIALPDGNIAVSGPTGTTVGNRTVAVTVNYQFQSPVQIQTFLNRLSGGSTTGLDTFTITNTATMRYEE